MANHLKRERKIMVVNLLCEGSSIRSAERITGVHRDTIGRMLLRVGDHCDRLMAHHIRRVESDQLEVDEIWAFIAKKQKRVRPGDPHEFGDAYTFIGLDAVSKLVVHHLVGKRDQGTAQAFMAELSRRIVGETQISVDGFQSYPAAIWDNFGNRAHAAAVVKQYRSTIDGERRYSPASVVGCRRRWLQGFPKLGRMCTSHVERVNLTCRTFVRRLTRLTCAFSKRLPNLKAAVSMSFCWYNFVRIHRSLGMTPGMAAEVTSTIWTIDDLTP